jgi:hypothetical protein
MVKPVESSLPQTSAELALTDYEFVQRVANISYVNKSLEMLNQKILPVVESNPYTKFAADTAASVAAAVVKPVLKTVEPYHDRVDSVGNRLVDVAENVVESGTKFALRAEQVLLSPLEKAVNGVDYVVDLVLPASEQEQRKFDEQQFVDANDNLSDEASTEDFPESESTVGPRPAPLKRAYEVSTKAGTRVYNVITSRSQKAYESTEELLHLRATWEILQHYQAQLEASSQKLRETLAATQQYLQETVSDREKLATSVQDAKDFGMEKIAKPTFESVLIVQNRLVEALAEVRSSVTHSIDAVRNRVPSLPFNIQERKLLNPSMLVLTFRCF